MILLRRLALASILLAACSADGSPGGPSAQVRRMLQYPGYDWITVEAPNTRVHFPAGSYAQSRQRVLWARVRDSRRDVFRTLGQPDDESILHVFYVDDREDMAALTGAPVTGYSYFEDGAVVLVFNADWQPFERHEMAHVVTLGRWPPPGDVAVVEGLATYVQGECGGYSNGRVARTIMDREGLLPLEALSADFRRQNDLVAYLQAASLLEFLIQSTGVGVVRELWDLGLGAAPSLTETTAPTLLSELEDWLRESFEPIPDPAMNAIRLGGCGIPRPL